MSRRRNVLSIGSVHHVFTRSIGGYEIFSNPADCQRMIEVMRHYRSSHPPCKFSDLERFISVRKPLSLESKGGPLVAIVSFCLMPTHIHLLLKQLQNEGISIFMRQILNSYTHYFNLKNDRKGPLWEGRFKNVSLENDGQLLHVTRYIHLNPVTAFLVDKPEKWEFSSYKEFVGLKGHGLFDSSCIEMPPQDYKTFVENRIDYQRELARIKDVIYD